MFISFYQEETPILSVWPWTTVLSASRKGNGRPGFRIILKAKKLLGAFQIAKIFNMNSALIAEKRWGETHTHTRVIFYNSKKDNKFVFSWHWCLYLSANKFGICYLIEKSVRHQRYMGEHYAMQIYQRDWKQSLTSEVLIGYLAVISHEHNKIFYRQFINNTFKERERDHYLILLKAWGGM